ncbi:hypothetical protein [Mangrovicoccus sp. HB161399]|uniref:hypothetical protein n=1 Tax=Mangrovicoccus sp. HB161399 TaxID=2720392 RepID=UPI001555969D|nr:hypothetical protein [Mangrovicoccus sp. HB161399]
MTRQLLRTDTDCLAAGRAEAPDFVPVEWTAPAAGTRAGIGIGPESPAIPAEEAPAKLMVAAAAELSAAQAMVSPNFAAVRHLLTVHNEDEIMLVLSAGQSLSIGTTVVQNYHPVWTGRVDPRAYMLDFGNDGLSARGWNHREVEPGLYRGMMPMESLVTETPAPAMVAQIFAAYDGAGQVAPDILHAGTGALGASVLELMTARGDLYGSRAAALADTADGDLFAIRNGSGSYDYFANDRGAAHYLDTHRWEPGLWDTMEAQIGYAAQAAARSGKDIHGTVAVGFVQGTADASLDDGRFGYGWALARYFSMIEQELRKATGKPGLEVEFALSQAQGKADAVVPLAQLDYVLAAENVHLAVPQYQYRFIYGSDPGTDNRHLTPEGYFHLGQGLGAALGQAMAGLPDPPMVIEEVSRGSGTELRVRFGGVEGRLVEDASLFSAAQGFAAPENFGFRLSEAGSGQFVEIARAEITGDDTVSLWTGGALEGGYRLWLGAHGVPLSETVSPGALQSWNAVTLRDSETAPMVAPDGYRGDTVDVFEFAPIQSFDLML